MSDFVRVEREHAVATLVIDRPETKNAMSHAMWDALRDHARAADADPSVDVLVIRSGVERLFSAGADLSEYRAHAGDVAWGDRNRALISEACDALRELTKPVIVEIHGACVGAGVGLALAADLRIADETARFAIPSARLGLVFPFTETRALVDLIGPARAKRMLLTARFVPAAEALEIGLVDEVVPKGTAQTRARELALELGLLSQNSLRAAKRMVAKVAAGQREEDQESWRLPGDALASDDHVARMRVLDRASPP
jgi:enoyl-CoA hydratase/carnithine racemase